MTKNIVSKVGEIDFSDFNGDGIRDILIQNSSDARSNWTYYLFLFDKTTKSFKNVMNFETIKNPSYNKKYNLVESNVISGTDYLSFYKIVNYKAYNVNYTIEDVNSENFESEYAKALKKLSK